MVCVIKVKSSFSFALANAIFYFFNQENTAIFVAILPHCAFNFRMPFMPNQNRFCSLSISVRNLHMHFSYQRTGCIKYFEITIFRFLSNRLRYAMRRKNNDSTIRQSRFTFSTKIAPRSRNPFTTNRLCTHFVTNINRCAMNF